MAAQMIVETGAHRVGLPAWPVIRAEAVDLEVLARDFDRPRDPARARVAGGDPPRPALGQPVKHGRAAAERAPRRVRSESAPGSQRG